MQTMNSITSDSAMSHSFITLDCPQPPKPTDSEDSANIEECKEASSDEDEQAHECASCRQLGSVYVHRRCFLPDHHTIIWVKERKPELSSMLRKDFKSSDLISCENADWDIWWTINQMVIYSRKVDPNLGNACSALRAHHSRINNEDPKLGPGKASHHHANTTRPATVVVDSVVFELQN
ncbi:hypothetical protein OPT61_g4736 [Boeremia exigua]|uniref:Uncharacterized protein n=1 Tax=Boeremia exigua TaxID=749465 RepID=A0ACC2ID83_9PLEO|nr:hypothetical protein OPT61_g4736 [Boeremia exigua]